MDFKKIFDITFLFFIGSLIVSGIAIYMSGTRNEPTNIQLKAPKSTNLYGVLTLNDKTIIKTISPGEDITILGQRMPSSGKSMAFWVETSDEIGVSFDKNLLMK